VPAHPGSPGQNPLNGCSSSGGGGSASGSGGMYVYVALTTMVYTKVKYIQS